MKLPRLLLAALLLVVPAVTGCKSATDAPSKGGLTIDISGLPGGTAATVTVTGPNGFTRTLSATETLSDLDAGDYLVTAANVVVGAQGYTAVEEKQTVTLSSGATQSVAVSYVNLNTTLTINIRGVSAGVTPSLRVTGPNGFDRTITRSTRLAGLGEGTYVISAAGYVSGDSTYQAQPARQNYVMTGNFPGSLDIFFGAAGPRSLNFRISKLYLLNVVQTPTGTIPLVKDRDAFLRVFVTADQANLGTPWVRVRLYDGTTLRSTEYLSPNGASVPTVVDDGLVERSWNLPVPGALVHSGLRVEAEVDPDNAVIESNEADNLYPASAGPAAVTVVNESPLRVRFIPIKQTRSGFSGSVDEASVPSFLSLTRKIYPVSDVQADVHAQYVSAGPALANDASGGDSWYALLDEIETLRVLEKTQGVHYVGIVHPNYTSGIVGLGFIGGNSVLSWDEPSDRSFTVAHELGHNLGRRHSPCPTTGNNVPGGIDPQYPDPTGSIAAFGYDVSTGSPKKPSDSKDIMGYCPANAWISAYTYEGVRSYREQQEPATAASVQPTVVVWGRMNDNGLVLEPSFQADARPTLPSARGPYTAEGLDASGAVLFSFPFAAKAVSDGRPDEQLFSLAIPLAADRAARLATVRVRAGGREASVRSTGAVAPGGIRNPDVTLESESGGFSLQWDRSQTPLVVVRDAATGEVLSLARGGQVSLRGVQGPVELLMSDGVRSVRRVVQPGVSR